VPDVQEVQSVTPLDPNLTTGHRALERHLRSRGDYDLADVARQVADEHESGGRDRTRTLHEWVVIRDMGELRRLQ
jgi:hypothetical protein